MNKSECLSAYQNEVFRQESPYKQWIMKKEADDNAVCEKEISKEVLRIIKMKEIASNFEWDAIQEKYCLFIGSDGEMASVAPAKIVEHFEKHGEVDIIYADEDEIDAATGERSHPWFKPDYAPDSLLASFYFGHLFAIRVDKFRTITWLRGQDYKVQIYDFVLKAVEQTRNIYHMPAVLFHQTVSNTYESVLGTSQAFDEIKIAACKRRGMKVTLAECGNLTAKDAENAGIGSSDKNKDTIRHICYKIEEKPVVSVIIPSKNHYDVLQQCIGSFMENTTYTNVEFIIVDNGSCEEQKEKIIQFLRSKFDDNNHYNCYYDYEEQPFNFSIMCNRGARRAKGQYLLFLNDDIEITSRDWLERMLGQAMQPHVGAVGCKLLYPEARKIQHVGITNMGIGPAHKLNGFVDDKIYVHGENCLVLNKIAVTAACLLVAKDKFERAGGFPSDMAVAYNDVALCFSLLKHGYLNVVRNDVALVHHESLSRGMDNTNDKKKRLLKEKNLLYTRYPKWDNRDPYYSRDWIQTRKDTDYTCNFIYEYEDEKLQNKITRVLNEQKKKVLKEKSSNHFIRKLLQQDALCFCVETIQGKGAVLQDGKQCFYYDTYDKEENDLLQITGWSLLQKKDNACYEYSYLLKSEDDVVIECKTYQQLRRDVEQTFQITHATHIALAGKTARVATDIMTPGKYKLGVAAKSLKNRKYAYVAWSEEYLFFFLTK